MFSQHLSEGLECDFSLVILTGEEYLERVERDLQQGRKVVRMIALRWIWLGLALFSSTHLTGCFATLVPKEVRFAVAPGYILKPTLTAVASILPLKQGETLESSSGGPPIVDRNFAYGGFLRDEYALERTGIYFTEDYDPKRIPILFVHGLLSDPYTWKKMTTRLSEDPEITERYQFWYYAYSTSEPAMASAATLRKHLTELDRKLISEGKGSIRRKVVLCGHSLGGILSKSLISSSGDDLWNAAFTKPLASLDLEPDQKEFLQDAFFFDPHPTVNRAIIMAAPIRGTIKVRTPIGAIGKALANEPDFIEDLMKDLFENNEGALDPGFVGAYGKKFDAITSLDPDLPLTSVYASTIIDPRIPFHSIAGVSNLKKKRKTDGWVPLESTKLDGALSRVEVESDHSVHEKEITAEIVKLILRYHSRLISEKQMIDGVDILGTLSMEKESAY